MKISEKDLKKRLKDINDRFNNPTSDAGKRETGVKCVAQRCGGEIIEQISYKYVGDPMLMIIGPGSRKQMTRSSSLYCKSCGVCYHHLPSSKRKKK